MISVVVSTYNRCESLKETLNSLLTQELSSDFDYEINGRFISDYNVRVSIFSQRI